MTLSKFLQSHPASLASLCIFDMDIYKPTLDCLKLMIPRLLNGTVLVFDQLLASDQFPGESLALQESGIMKNLQPTDIGNSLPYTVAFKYHH